MEKMKNCKKLKIWQKLAKIEKIEKNWQKMVKNWSKMAKNGQKRQKMEKNGKKLKMSTMECFRKIGSIK